MIVKYLENGVWGYIDNIRQAANKDIDCDELIKRYGETHTPENDIASYIDGKKLPDEIIASNKIFIMATDDVPDEGINQHQVNLMDGVKAIDNYPASVIILYVEDCKEYDAITLVTNQTVYLMNDKGQTIERLV